MARVPWWVWVSVVACAAVSLVSLSSRHRVEVSNRAVGIMMSMEDVEAIASASRQPIVTVFEDLKSHGLTGVAFSEDTLGDLIESGNAKIYDHTILSNPEPPRVSLPSDPLVEPIRVLKKPLPKDAFTIRFDLNHPELPPIDLTQSDKLLSTIRVNQILASLRDQRVLLDSSKGPPNHYTTMWPGGGIMLIYPGTGGAYIRTQYRSELDELSVGIDSRFVSLASDAGLVAVARLQNSPHIDKLILQHKIEEAKESGASAILIAGDQAIGNRDLIEKTRDALIANDMTYISPEFVVLGGDSYLRRELADRTIRLHSISAIEAERMSERDLNERFAKAFRERGARWLLLRPTTKASDDPLKQVGETLVSLRTAIRKAGGEVKEPRPFEDVKSATWLVCLIGLLSMPAVAWAAMQMLGKTPLAWSVVGLFAAVDVTTFLTEDAKKLALLMALAFPVIGYLIVVKSMKKAVPLRDFLLFTAISMVGGLAVGGMLTGVEFMIRADQFIGTKLALFGPLLVVGFLLLRQHGTIKDLLKKPVTWGTATISIVGMAAMFMLLARSGNENPAAVSGLELQVRSILDQLLFVRPRTKEVILGHPALVLGLMMMLHRPNFKGWAALLLFVGMVGQTSVVNTFCHLHTPIALSLARVGTGVVLGGIIGLLLWVVIKRWIPTEETI